MSRLIRLGGSRRSARHGKGFRNVPSSAGPSYGSRVKSGRLDHREHGRPLLTEWVSALYGWRSAFIISGGLGMFWIPLWLAVARRAPVLQDDQQAPRSRVKEMLRDRRYLSLVVANILAMTIYSLWTNWTTVFLVSSYGLSQQEANLRFAWMPPIFATLGGLLGAWLANRAIRNGVGIITARLRISIAASVFALATAFAPMASRPALAVAAICVSFFAVTCLSVNYYAIPLDLFGGVSAGFAISLLTGVFGLMQAFLSPLIGGSSEKYGWQPVCLAIAALPLASAILLHWSFRKRWA